MSSSTRSPFTVDANGQQVRVYHHVMELLAPLYPDIPYNEDMTVYSVAFKRTADDWLQMLFPTLSRPGKIISFDVACINKDKGCRCYYVRLLRSMMILMEQHVLRVTAKYVISSIKTTPSPCNVQEGGIKYVASIQLFVQLHERIGQSKATLQDFDLLLCHLQPSLVAAVHRTNIRTEFETRMMLEKAEQSRCHVVGCDMHPIKSSLDQNGPSSTKPSKRWTLSDVFQNLISPIEVDQMEVRDDYTYMARMKRTKRQLILTDLPVSALHILMWMLDARSLASMSGVCSMFQHIAYEVVPGLKLVLYSHQRKGLKWMLRREGASRQELMMMPHPFLFPSVFVSSEVNRQGDANNLKDMTVIDLVEKKLVKRSDYLMARDFRGGLFCDEPGLGKTITMLALILRTKGQRSEAVNDLQHVHTVQTSKKRAYARGLRSANARDRQLKLDELIPSAASLIVVPNSLVEHWRYQLETHLDPGLLNVYVDHFEAKGELPMPAELAQYDVVITTFSRLAQEWKFRRPTSALEERRPDRYGFENAPMLFVDGLVCQGISSLLQVHWVRIVVDEGHKLGGTTPTYHMRMAWLLHADKRWVMTGTPTPNTLHGADLRHLHGLLVFLRDQPYGISNGKVWLKAISRPFEQGDQAGYIRLLTLLNRIMMRHTKESIRNMLPDPIRHTVFINPTKAEYDLYNSVAATVRSNLVLTNIDPYTPGKDHLDSLLNPIHRAHAMRVLRNVRDACCSGGTMEAELTNKSRLETIDMLTELGVDTDRQAEVLQFISRARNMDELTECGVCHRSMQLVMVVPCGHLACADCVESQINNAGPMCSICGAAYDRELFQILQPGFETRRKEDSIRYGDDYYGVNGPVPLKSLTSSGDYQSSARISNRSGNRERHVFIPIDLTRFEPIRVSKAYYVAQRISELRQEFAKQRENGAAEYRRGSFNQAKHVKAIVYSQFNENLWRVKVSLAQHGIKCEDFIIRVSAKLRMQSLIRFRNDPSANVLLLTDIGSHGLDLSFVTHIFLMDEIWDKSVEQQVISRAHRMGARHAVAVEQLVMRGSIEEVMHEINARGLLAMPSLHKSRKIPLSQTLTHEQKHQREIVKSEKWVKSSKAASLEGASRRERKRILKAESEIQKQRMRNNGDDAQQEKLHYLLQRLQLLDECIIAEEGTIHFRVVDENDVVVREASHQLPELISQRHHRTPSAPRVSSTAGPKSPTTNTSAGSSALLQSRETQTSTHPPRGASGNPHISNTVSSPSHKKKKSVKFLNQNRNVMVHQDVDPGFINLTKYGVKIKNENTGYNCISQKKNLKGKRSFVVDDDFSSSEDEDFYESSDSGEES